MVFDNLQVTKKSSTQSITLVVILDEHGNTVWLYDFMQTF